MITHYRVDERVIHGQTTTKLTKEAVIHGIIVVDDKIAADPFMVQLYKTTLPESIKVYCFNTEKALRKLPEADASQKNYLVIFKYTDNSEQLIKAGYRLCIPAEYWPSERERRFNLHYADDRTFAGGSTGS